MKAVCQVPGCGWESWDGLAEKHAQELSVTHVIAEHPNEYTRVTGKQPAELSEIQRWELDLATHRRACHD